MLNGETDVVVTDGFTGNMVLKTSEGIAKFMLSSVKEEINKSFMAKLGALILKSSLKHIVTKMDSSEYGGAIFLGLNGLSIKAHGNSDATAIKNAIKVANRFAEMKFIDELKNIIDMQDKEI